VLVLCAFSPTQEGQAPGPTHPHLCPLSLRVGISLYSRRDSLDVIAIAIPVIPGVSCSIEAAGHGLQDRYQDTGADERDEDAAAEVEIALNIEKTGQVSADEAADQANDDIPDTAVTTTAHEGAGEKACDQANNNPGKKVKIKVNAGDICKYH